jgi:hypothetical protein
MMEGQMRAGGPVAGGSEHRSRKAEASLFEGSNSLEKITGKATEGRDGVGALIEGKQ